MRQFAALTIRLSKIPRISAIPTSAVLSASRTPAFKRNAMSSSAPSSASSLDEASKPPTPAFPVSPIPQNPLGEGKHIRTAAALIIGDEILNGKTHDKNSHFFAQYCFEHGIELKRIEVIADDEAEIIEASRRMVKNYDFVVTSGGIGPTHDDITYASLAASFNQKLVHDPETIRRLTEATKYRNWAGKQDESQLAAMHRMALFPENAEILFVGPDIWVPVIRMEGKLCVFPGIPKLFQRMLNALTPYLPLPPKSERQLRIQIFTERPESMIAPYLTSLQARLKPHNIQVGSYPILYKGVYVSLIGRDLPINEKGDRVWLAEVAKEVETEINGRVCSDEEVAEQKKAEAGGIDIADKGGDLERKAKF